MEEERQVPGELTGRIIKWIAVVTMFIDHIGASLLEWYVIYMPTGPAKVMVRNIDQVVRGIGRLAFPLFIFLMVEGFFYTRSRFRYAARLALFAAISEIPFDLAFFLRRSVLNNHILWDTRHQNVFFTLVIGFLAMWVMETLRPKHWEKDDIKSWAEALLRIALCAAAAYAACRLADWLHTDYSWKGVLAMELAYLIRLAGRTDLEIFGILAALLFSSRSELVAILDYELIRRYHGKKGKSGGRWFFYIFYPAHLLVLGLLRVVFILR